MIAKQKNIFDHGYINYYLSASSPLIEKIVESGLDGKIKIEKSEPLFNGDYSKKYKLSIANGDKDTEYLLLWMFRSGLVVSPKISDIPIYCFSSDDNIIKKFIPQNLIANYEIIKDKIGIKNLSKIDSVTKLGKYYPIKVVTEFDYYKSYRCKTRYQRKDDYYYVCDNEKIFENKFKDLCLKLKEKGIISAKWVSEFELYCLVKKYFSNTVYQYRTSWLGLQSLDIYIPEKRIGIEYQGIQHYEPVDFFGGEDGYHNQLVRDEEKKEKCKQANVVLLYWDYRITVNDCNLIDLFDSVDIDLKQIKGK